MSKQPSRLEVREMTLADVGLRIDYFHDADDAYLTQLGVDRSLLPSREAWNRLYQADYARPIEQREYYSLLWQLDGETVGFSSTDRIEFGAQAWMQSSTHSVARIQEWVLVSADENDTWSNGHRGH